MTYKCPVCHMEFEDKHIVHVNDFEPFTAVNVIEGLTAYAAYGVDKQLTCHDGKWVHITFPDGEHRLIEMVKYDPDHLEAVHEHNAHFTQPCQHEGCTNTDTTPCYINWIDEEPEGYYCDEHIAEEGFCQMCGLFAAGTEHFDFIHPGYCDACWDQLKSESEFDDYDEYEEEDADFYSYGDDFN